MMSDKTKTLILRSFAVVLVLAGIAGLLLRSHHTAQAYGQCVSACLAERKCDLDFTSGRAHAIGPDCLIDQNECMEQCGGTVAAGPPVAFHQASNISSIPVKGAYGAIAYDKASGAWGLADASLDQASANRSALGFCGRYGAHCLIADSFSNMCAAVATGGKNEIAWAKAADRDTAQKTAGANCAKKTKTSCTVRLSNCYFP